jgi:serine/threonine protein kinase
MPDTDPTPSRDPVEALAEDFLRRRRAGEAVDIDDYAARHPDLAEAIRACFPALLFVEDVRPGDETAATGSAERPGPSRAPGHLGDYRIVRELGRGGMGIVYEAEQVSLGRRVALKVLPDHAALDPRRLRRFHREAQAAARLHHTNIVPLFGVGEQDGLPYLVMQYVPGRSLEALVADRRKSTRTPGPGDGGTSSAPETYALPGSPYPPGPLQRPDAPAPSSPSADGPGVSSTTAIASALPGPGPAYWRAIARIGLEAAEALAYAHEQGILHRDIKPSNLLLDEEGKVWVLDFGLAKLDSDARGLTRTGDLLGTVRYMAPERFRGPCDARSDVYGLGLTLYELLTLRPAFDGDPAQLIHRVTHEEPPRPRSIDPRIPADLETIVQTAIARDPTRRYASAGALAEDLRRFLDDRPIRARRAGAPELAWRWARRNPALAGLLGTVAAVGLLGFAGVTWQWLEAEAARDRADGRERAERAARGQAEEALKVAARAAEDQRLAREEAERALYASRIANAWSELRVHNVAGAARILEGCPPAHRGWEWAFLGRLLHGEMLDLRGHSSWVFQLASSPDGTGSRPPAAATRSPGRGARSGPARPSFGTRRPDGSSRHSPIPTRSRASPLAPTVGPWPPPAATAPSGSGTPRPAHPPAARSSRRSGPRDSPSSPTGRGCCSATRTCP